MELCIGTYESEEITLKILDQIQDIMTNNLSGSGSYEEVDLKLKAQMINSMYKIYQMPATKEGGN